MSDHLSIQINDEIPALELFAAVEAAQELYRAGLASAEGHLARRHLSEERQLPAELVESEGFGYVGAGWSTLTDHLARQGVRLEAAAQAGLVLRSVTRVKREFERSSGRPPRSSAELSEFFTARCQNRPAFYYDYPRCFLADGSRESGHWLTIPIRVEDPEGRIRVAGFQYRTMRPADQVVKQGRYMSPLRSSRLLSWSELIMGAAEQAEAMKRSGEVIICEGKFDQAAVLAAVAQLPDDARPGVVALAGVAIRGATGESPAERAGIFRQLAVGRATFFLDGDETGTDAVLAAGPLLEALGTRVSVARIEASGVKDPGELYAKHGATAILHALAQARSRGLATHALDLIEETTADNSRSGQAWHRLRSLDRLLPVLRALPDAVRERAVRRCVERTGIGYGVFEAGLQPDLTEAAPKRRPRRSARR